MSVKDGAEECGDADDYVTCLAAVAAIAATTAVILMENYSGEGKIYEALRKA